MYLPRRIEQPETCDLKRLEAARPTGVYRDALRIYAGMLSSTGSAGCWSNCLHPSARRRAEETLRRVLGEAPEAPVPAQDAEAEIGRAAGSLIERAEGRALRLFIGAPDSRPLLAGLRFRTPLHQRAMEHLQEVQRRLPQQPVVPGRDPLAEFLLALSSRMEPELADLLQRLCVSAQKAQESLGRNLEQELMAVLDVLEPVDS